MIKRSAGNKNSRVEPTWDRT